MLRSKCATLVLRGGGGNVSWGRLALVFPGFARFQHVAHFRSFRLSFDKFTENSLFLRNGAYFWVVTRKNRSFCGMRGAICVKLSANFWKCFFLRPRAKCRSFGKSWLGAGVVIWKFWKSLPKIVRSAVGSVWRADTEPQKMYGWHGARRICTCFWGPLSALLSTIQIFCFLASGCGGNDFFFMGSLSALWGTKNGAPYQPIRIYIYIYIWL